MESIITTIVPLLWNPLLQRIKYLTKVDDNIKALNEALDDLKLGKAEVEEKIRSGEARTDKHGPTDRASKWLNDVRAIEVEVASLVEGKYSKRKICCHCLGGYRCPFNCWSSYKISQQATNLTVQIQDLINKKEKMDQVVTQKLGPVAWKEMPGAIAEAASSASTVQSYLDKACDYIQDVGVGMVGIYGMGGVGKTTLLKSINNHLPAVDATFDHVIWLVASQDLNINNLQKLVAEKVSFYLDFDSTTVEERGESLCDFLREKKILLFLDDIWQPIELGKLGVRFPINDNDDDNDNKVVFTTRSEKVCNEMMAYHRGVHGKKIKVDCLYQDEAWELFLNNVGETAKSSIDSNEKVREFAKQVAKKCGGLPLALIVIARAMSSNETWIEWEVAFKSLNEFDMEELSEEESGLFPLLKKSYESLPNETMRKCFLSFSLWPEDESIPEDYLIHRWLGLNLIDVSNFRLAYNKGVTILEGLKRACLLEEVENDMVASVKMHDIILGMASWIASNCGTNKNKWIVHFVEEEDVTSCGEAEVMLLRGSKLNNLPQNPSFHKLSALFLDECEVGKESADVLFQNMPALKCLDINFCNINEIPSSIGCLVGLRFLHFSNLDDLVVVPIELSNLTELKYLHLWCGGEFSIPHGLISRLKKLQYFSINGYKRWGGEGEASLEELGFGSKAVGMEIYAKSMMEQICAIRQVVSLWDMLIIYLEGETSLPLLEFIGGERATADLQSLSIESCNDLEEIVMSEKWQEEFSNLQSLHLSRLNNLRNIAWGAGEVKPGVVFRNVTVLSIFGCPCLKGSLTWIGQLIYLKRFRLWDCENLVQVIGDRGVREEEDDEEEDNEVVVDDIKKEEEEEEEEEIEEEEETLETLPPIFSHLKYLQLFFLPSLTSFSSQKMDLRSLKYLEISCCPRLDLSPFSNHRIHSG